MKSISVCFVLAYSCYLQVLLFREFLYFRSHITFLAAQGAESGLFSFKISKNWMKALNSGWEYHLNTVTHW